MSVLSAEQIVTSSLKKRGASCILNTIEPNVTIIIATWKSTVWRILVKAIINKNEINFRVINEEIKKFQGEAVKSGQTSVIAWVYPNGDIEYRSAEGKVIRPRCLVKSKRIKILKKESYEKD